VILRDLGIPGPCLVEQERFEDGRGYFARTFAQDAFAAAGLESEVAECSVSFNREPATLRGMHLQRSPFAEAKLVRCTRGRIWDVAVDVRPASPSFGTWTAAELDDVSGLAMYIPTGFAHGFVTLEPASEVLYQISQPYNPAASIGFRWDDPDVSVAWPVEPVVISDRDMGLPSLAGLRSSLGDGT
jgi:dTDP-4-dehydrorhamnose 3,5-epimerase